MSIINEYSGIQKFLSLAYGLSTYGVLSFDFIECEIQCTAIFKNERVFNSSEKNVIISHIYACLKLLSRKLYTIIR